MGRFTVNAEVNVAIPFPNVYKLSQTLEIHQFVHYCWKEDLRNTAEKRQVNYSNSTTTSTANLLAGWFTLCKATTTK